MHMHGVTAELLGHLTEKSGDGLALGTHPSQRITTRQTHTCHRGRAQLGEGTGVWGCGEGLQPSVRQELALGAAEAPSEGGWKKVAEASQADIWKNRTPGRPRPRQDRACHVPRPGLRRSREATACHSTGDL